jgi:F0F1-type ATP synthase assembly protein I
MLAFIRAYLAMLIIHLLFSMGSGIYAIHRNFEESPKYISDCISGSHDKLVTNVCKDSASLTKSIMIGIFIGAWLIETWACFIVVNYSKQLGEEELRNSMVKDSESW